MRLRTAWREGGVSGENLTKELPPSLHEVPGRSATQIEDVATAVILICTQMHSIGSLRQ